MSEDTCALACEKNNDGHCTAWAKPHNCQRWRVDEGGRAVVAKTLAPELVESVKQVMVDTATALPPLEATAADIPAMELAELLAKAHWYGYVKPLILAHGVGDEVAQVVEFHYISAFVHGYKHGVEGSR